MSVFSQLAEEATRGGAGEEKDIDNKIQEALACPCIGDLKEGPCGPTFVTAFACFIRSEHEDKGMDCLPQFKLFQECLQRHPEHVARMMEDPTEASEEGAGAAAAGAPGGSPAPAGGAAAAAGGAAGAGAAPAEAAAAGQEAQRGAERAINSPVSAVEKS